MPQRETVHVSFWSVFTPVWLAILFAVPFILLGFLFAAGALVEFTRPRLPSTPPSASASPQSPLPAR